MRRNMILQVHEAMLANSPNEGDRGMTGVLYMGTVEHIADYRINDALKEAAWVLHAIATQHPFYQGNKRTAFAVADVMLREKGEYIRVRPKYGREWMLHVAAGCYKVNEVQEWITKHLEELPAPEPDLESNISSTLKRNDDLFRVLSAV